MHPVLFSIGPITVYSYGFMLAVAFILAAYLASKRAHIFNISKETVNGLTLTLLISGIIGSRIFYIISNLAYFTEHPYEVIFINRGGLVFYGGFFLALLAGIIFAKINRVSILDAGDLIAPFVAIGHSVGRIGCFLNGCCYGKPTGSFFGVRFPYADIKVIPVQLFSSAGLFVIFLLLFYLQKRRTFKGEILLLYLILYGVFRFFIEFLRGDLSPVFYHLTATQLISIAVVIVGFVFLWKRKS